MPYNARQPHRPGRSHARSPRLPVRSRRWRLDRRSLLLALLLFGLLVLLATLGRHWGWIRSFGGDLLAVVWLYYLMGSALQGAGRLAGIRRLCRRRAAGTGPVPGGATALAIFQSRAAHRSR
ncbi:hypothetical protein P4198_29510 [Pseudomonas aeruginosa]|nr:hypothetical protein [Pseudomonas aeruginosa]